MKGLFRKRGGGKTTALVYTSAITGYPIVVPTTISKRYVKDVARRVGVSIPEPIVATVYKGNIIKNLIMDCQSYTKYRPNETTGGIFVSWRRKEELPTGA